MNAADILSTLVAVATWPASRFASAGRTYDLSIDPSYAYAVIRGGVGVDPLYLPVGEGLAHSARPEAVGRFRDAGFDLYISGRFSSGLGLIGTVKDTPTGSQVITHVGWSGLNKWVMPGVTIVALCAATAMAFDIPEAISKGGSDASATFGLIAICVGGQLANLISRERRARRDDLPMLFEQLERALAPYRR